MLRVLYAVSMRLADEMRRVADDRLDHVQVLAISVLGRMGPLAQTDLAARLGQSRVFVTRMVDDLETAGLVDRSAHHFDRRRKMVKLSEAGTALFQTMRARTLELAHEIFRETTDERLAVIDSQTVKIAQRLSLALGEPLPGLDGAGR